MYSDGLELYWGTAIPFSPLEADHGTVKYNVNYGELNHPGVAFFGGELNIIKCQFVHAQLYIIKTVVRTVLLRGCMPL